MTDHRDERVLSAMMHAVAEYVGRESNRTSLITLTSGRLSPSGDELEILVSVLPKEQTGTAIDFLNRQRTEMNAFLKKRVSMRVFPRLTFLPDPAMGTVE